VKPTLRVLSCFESDGNGNLRHSRLDRERKKQREWVTKSREAGYKSAAKRWGYKRKASITNLTKMVTPNGNQGGNQKVTLQSSSSSSSSYLKDKSIAALPPGEPAKSAKREDEAYDTFCSEYLGQREVPYRSSKGDFVQLASLRKSLNLNGSTPDRWVDAVRNYLSSPLAKYTIADLCSRFDVFIHGGVDRFGKPRDTRVKARPVSPDEIPGAISDADF